MGEVGEVCSGNLPSMKLSKDIHLCSIPNLYMHTLLARRDAEGVPAPQALVGMATQWPAGTCVAVVQPDPLPVVLAAAPHHVV